jgi:hypothetical protein
MSAEARELVRRQFEDVFNGQQLDACDEIFAQEYVEHAVAPFQATSREPLRGRSTCAAW